MAASIVVFLLIVNISLITWNVAERNTVMFTEERDMRDRASRIVSLISRTSGHPENWNASDVEIVGVADPSHIVQEDKLNELEKMSYQKQKQKLRVRDYEFLLDMATSQGDSSPVLGGQPLALMVEESASPEDQNLFRVLNQTGYIWDLYWPSSDGEGVTSSLTARHVYNYSEDGEQMFDDLITNASGGSYETVIGEDVNVDTDDIQHGSSLKSFVEGGNTYIHTEEKAELIEDTFGLDRVSINSENGAINKTAPLLNTSRSRGAFVEFEDEDAAFVNMTTTFVSDTGQFNACLACGWDIGAGKLYYIADVKHEDTENLITFESGQETFGSVSFKKIGKPATDEARLAAVSQRRVMINGSNSLKPGRLELVLWR